MAKRHIAAKQLVFDEPELLLHPETMRKVRSITKREERGFEGIERIRLAREADKQQLGYLAKPFLLMGLPFRPVLQKDGKKATEYSRTNGNETLKIIGDSELGLPFGEDILVLIWVSTLAVLNMDKATGKVQRTIEFRRAADMLKAFDLPLNGDTYRRMQQRFLRVFYATFYLGERNDKGRVKVYSVRFFDNIDLWFTRDLESDTLPGADFCNRITLSEAFAADLERHRPPLDMEAVRTWANKPGQLYFYMWLVFRCYVARSTSHIPLEDVREQCGVQGYEGAVGAKNFRRKLKAWLQGVREAWPDCPAAVTVQDGREYLTIRRSRTAIHRKSEES